jgi:hypothetical protein
LPVLTHPQSVPTFILCRAPLHPASTPRVQR